MLLRQTRFPLRVDVYFYGDRNVSSLKRCFGGAFPLHVHTHLMFFYNAYAFLI